MKKNLILIFFLTGFFSFSQEPISNGLQYELNSTILKEKRIIQVQLPKNYSNEDFSKANYPVVYVLDGDFNFALVSSIERFNTKFLYRPQPEMIVVGINSTDRTRDFTPTKETVRGRDGQLRFQTSGGADEFLKFLDQELKPFIEKEFRTNGYNSLIGHSFGGLFAMYTLMTNPELFQSYIVLDPGLWWDDQFVYKRISEKWDKTDFTKQSLFVALAYEEPENAKDRFAHGSTIKNFCEEYIDKQSLNGLRSAWKYYPDYDHGLVPIAGILDGMIFTFEGIQLPVKKIPENPNLIKETYETFSQKAKFRFYPEESLLVELIKFSISVNQKQNAKEILTYALDLYPDSKQLSKLKNE